jgi:hypothetical protein
MATARSANLVFYVAIVPVRTRLMIVDHIASGSALVLPLQRIACPGRRHLAANFGRGL